MCKEKNGKDVINFFFQAEDGIRDHCVTGVQTCALPIFDSIRSTIVLKIGGNQAHTIGACISISMRGANCRTCKIGRASCRERV